MGVGMTYSAIESLNINLGHGSDTFTFLSTNGGTITTLHVNEGNDTVHVKVTQAGAGVTFINGDDGIDTINVQSFTGSLVIDSGSGDDTINFGSKAPASSGVLNNILGPVTLTGNSGRDTANFDETGELTNNEGTLTNS